MPAKSKRKQQLEGVREAKKLKRDDFSKDVSTDSELCTSALLIYIFLMMMGCMILMLMINLIWRPKLTSLPKSGLNHGIEMI